VQKKSRTEISIEIHEVVLTSLVAALPAAWCATCGREVQVARVADAQVAAPRIVNAGSVKVQP